MNDLSFAFGNVALLFPDDKCLMCFDLLQQLSRFCCANKNHPVSKKREDDCAGCAQTEVVSVLFVPWSWK